jgi:virginiamycin A acetyltransferase
VTIFTQPLPDPDRLHPVEGLARVVFLRPLLVGLGEAAPRNVEVGAFTYYDDAVRATSFFSRNLLYNITQGTRLSIGKFCALATGASFMFPDANHGIAGPSTFPFGVFGGAFAEALPLADYIWRPAGETLVGNDVWIGMDALVMPGVRIGHGAVVGARAVVTRDVPDYAVVAGNPARVVKRRYAEDEAARLVALGWWDWPVADIARAVPLLVNGDVAALEDFAAHRLP